MKNKNKGLFIILSSPSGAGKTTLAKNLIKNNKNMELSISYTTRKKRPIEKNNKDYVFVSEQEFEVLKRKKHFIEWAKVFNNYYGTSLLTVKRIHNKGKDVLFDIDWQGSRKIKKKLGKDVVSIFILPPSKKELIRRLKKRAQDPDHIVKKRLSFYKMELSHWKEYKYVVINKNLNETVNKIKSIIEAERIISQKNSLIKKKIRFL
ncbi:MAG: Guanylate kinase [Alphaproteobacteria bacterium MarineAlpha6_Bin6]|nr:MAG: Guanylate kinase [Alphaproteobacteria bacterium MarineAlpha6_Bin6]PPR32754.1 MAG: Guanylate kinase [Alphaproteobacteria bacterium MarineAlpha6_Bin5]|tara:strand:+ start:500 stop:1117 length:618 start_codon:yes stop_codon:yes gene_type:complete